MAVKLHTGADFNNQRARAAADPTAATDLTTKQYVDNLINGLRWKQPVRVATTTNGTLATAFANGQTVDGVTLATGDRILVKNQTTQSENGIYVVAASGAPTRASDADSASELSGATVLVTEGTTNADKAYTQTADSITLGTTNLTWTQFGGMTTYTADGQGIELVGSTFSLELDGTSLSKSASGVRIGTNAAGAGLTESNGILAVGQGTGITVAADTVSIDTSVVVRKYATAVGDNSTLSFAVTHNLGTRDVVVQVFEAATPYTQVLADVTADTANQITVAFGTAPTTGQYRVVVQG